MKVGPSSTIRVKHNVYSVDSRLIRERIQVRLYIDHLEIWYGQKKVDTLPRQRGEGKCVINYRHIIDSLVRKPGAFANYRYRNELFPTSRFRIAYDNLKARHTLSVAVRQYLKILYLSAHESEVGVDDVLRTLINEDIEISDKLVKNLVLSNEPIPSATEIHISPVDLTCYDQLLQEVVLC